MATGMPDGAGLRLPDSWTGGSSEARLETAAGPGPEPALLRPNKTPPQMNESQKGGGGRLRHIWSCHLGLGTGCPLVPRALPLPSRSKAEQLWKPTQLAPPLTTQPQGLLGTCPRMFHGDIHQPTAAGPGSWRQGPLPSALSGLAQETGLRVPGCFHRGHSSNTPPPGSRAGQPPTVSSDQLRTPLSQTQSEISPAPSHTKQAAQV